MTETRKKEETGRGTEIRIENEDGDEVIPVIVKRRVRVSILCDLRV